MEGGGAGGSGRLLLQAYVLRIEAAVCVHTLQLVSTAAWNWMSMASLSGRRAPTPPTLSPGSPQPGTRYVRGCTCSKSGACVGYGLQSCYSTGCSGFELQWNPHP